MIMEFVIEDEPETGLWWIRQPEVNLAKNSEEYTGALTAEELAKVIVLIVTAKAEYLKG